MKGKHGVQPQPKIYIINKETYKVGEEVLPQMVSAVLQRKEFWKKELSYGAESMILTYNVPI